MTRAWSPVSHYRSWPSPRCRAASAQRGEIARLHRGLDTEKFSYHDKGTMATIGRGDAVLQMPIGLKMTGVLAWLGWIALHIVFLLGGRNQVQTLINLGSRYAGPRRSNAIVGDVMETPRIKALRRGRGLTSPPTEDLASCVGGASGARSHRPSPAEPSDPGSAAAAGARRADHAGRGGASRGASGPGTAEHLCRSVESADLVRSGCGGESPGAPGSRPHARHAGHGPPVLPNGCAASPRLDAADARQPLSVRGVPSPPARRHDLDVLCQVAREVATPEPLTRVQLGRRLAEAFPGVSETALAYAATYLEPLVQVPPRGVWQRRGAVRGETTGGGWASTPGPAARIEDVLLRYLAAFGPAGVADMRIWSGLPGLREVVDRLQPRLESSSTRAVGSCWICRTRRDRSPMCRPGPVLARVRQRAAVPRGPVPRHPRPADRAAAAGRGARVGTVLVDGVFRATWRLLSSAERTVLHVDAEPRLSAQEADAVVDEARRLAGFLRPGEIPTDIVLG